MIENRTHNIPGFLCVQISLLSTRPASVNFMMPFTLTIPWWPSGSRLPSIIASSGSPDQTTWTLRVGLARQQENPNKSFLLTLQLVENVSKDPKEGGRLEYHQEQG